MLKQTFCPIKAHRTSVCVKAEETSANKLFVRRAETIQKPEQNRAHMDSGFLAT
jgi:hypothetical protein